MTFLFRRHSVQTPPDVSRLPCIRTTIRDGLRVRVLEDNHHNSHPTLWFIVEYAKGNNSWGWMTTISDLQMQTKIDLLQEALDSLDRGYRQLRSVKIGPKAFYIDERLMQLRNVANPDDFVDIPQGDPWSVR
ncbi:MAG TPA: hypothetical protein VMV69_10430 [Pirellulales bacterium]|nr:hypothetical protein [Pirellulales bacterium]